MENSEQALYLYDAERGRIEITGALEDDEGRVSKTYVDFCDGLLLAAPPSLKVTEKLLVIFENCLLGDYGAFQYTAHLLHQLSAYGSLYVVFYFVDEEQLESAKEMEDIIDVPFEYISLN